MSIESSTSTNTFGLKKLACSLISLPNVNNLAPFANASCNNAFIPSIALDVIIGPISVPAASPFPTVNLATSATNSSKIAV